MNNLSKKAKIALASGGVGLLALAAVLGIWQPWNKAPEEPEDSPGQQQQQRPPEPQKPEEGPSLTVGGEKIPCTIYEGDGWSIYVPEGWTVDDSRSADGIWVMRPDGAAEGTFLQVENRSYSDYAGDFVGAYPIYISETEQHRGRIFYTGAVGAGSWTATCQAPAEDWDTYQKLMTALARTMTVGEEKPFSGLSPVASEPDWQTTDGVTVLWMDKDGYVVDDEARKFVEEEMLGWEDETKAHFTGQYRLVNLSWAGSYTCLPGREYVDVFQFGVRYEVAPDKIEERREALKENGWEDLLEDGWQARSRYPMNVVIFHDGSAVEEVRVFMSHWDEPGGAPYLNSLLWDDPKSATPLTAEKLKQCAGWFNDRENNGLLRFAYEGIGEVGDYLGVLFYDLGDTEDKLTQAEQAALEKAGAALELDTFRRTRAYVLDYLGAKFWGASQDWAETKLADSGDQLGIYLAEFDAWYNCHGDTAMQAYTFDRGEFYPAGGGYVKLYYTAPYLWREEGTGEFDVPMVVTLRPGTEGADKWLVASNVPAE